MLNKIKKVLSSVALIKQIAVGLVIGILIAVFTPTVIPVVKIFGDLFVKALKGVAPVLVFFLVMNAMAQKKEGTNANMKPIIILYVIGTFCASLVGVALSFLFPTVLHLQVAADAKLAPPSGIIEVLHNVILSVVDNPVNALLTANYIGILAWAIIAGLALKSYANGTTKSVLDDIARAITQVVTWVIHFAPLGIMGLVADSVGTAGVDALLGYAKLLAVLIGAGHRLEPTEVGRVFVHRLCQHRRADGVHPQPSRQFNRSCPDKTVERSIDQCRRTAGANRFAVDYPAGERE